VVKFVFIKSAHSHLHVWGLGVRELIRGLATVPQSNQEPLVVKGKVGRPPSKFGVSKSMECDTFSLHCSDTVGWLTGRASGL